MRLVKHLTPQSLALVLILMVCIVLGRFEAHPAFAGGVVGECTESELRAALAGGGDVNFTCGPAIITVTNPLIITATNTTLDGGGVISLSGRSTMRVFTVSAAST